MQRGLEVTKEGNKFTRNNSSKLRSKEKEKEIIIFTHLLSALQRNHSKEDLLVYLPLFHSTQPPTKIIGL